MTMVRSARWSQAPRWFGLLVGVGSVLVGVLLVTRPFQSLAVLTLLAAAGFILTGVGELTDRTDAVSSRTRTVAGVLWILGGVVVLFWPGLSLRALSVIVAVTTIAHGVARALSALRGDTDYRAAALLLGAAGIILGLVALAWPDVTLLVVAVVFGVQVVIFGIVRILDAVRDPTGTAPGRGRGAPTLLGGFVRTAGAALALLFALGVALLSVRAHQGAPQVDDFYRAPAKIPATPGALLRTEPMTRALPPGAQAWRMLYTTTRSDGVPALASGLVVAPVNPPPGPRPVITWAHGTTGVAAACAPSVLKDPFAAGATPALEQVVANGWVLVATDYTGLGTEGPHAYLVGEQAGRAVLDAVRAARQMPEVSLADETVVWGHSQGGGAALWTGILAPTYAPDTNVIGVAAMSPASDLPALVGNLDVIPGGAIFASYVIQGYSDAYSDVRFDEYVRPTARTLAREMASRCLAEPSVTSSILESLFINSSIWGRDPLSGRFGERMRENVPSGPIPAPLLIGQGLADPLVLPAAQAAYVQVRCEAGGQVDYRTYPGFEHVDVVGAESPLIPDLLAWTQDRFDGKPAQSTCERHTFTR